MQELTSSELIDGEAILEVLHGQGPVGADPPGVNTVLVQDEAAHEENNQKHEPGGRIGKDERAGQRRNDAEQAQRKLVDEHEEEPEGEEPAQS